MAGCLATHGKTRYSGKGRVYNVVIESCAEHATRYLLERAVALVEAVVRAQEFPLEATRCAARGARSRSPGSGRTTRC